MPNEQGAFDGRLDMSFWTNPGAWGPLSAWASATGTAAAVAAKVCRRDSNLRRDAQAKKVYTRAIDIDDLTRFDIEITNYSHARIIEPLDSASEAGDLRTLDPVIPSVMETARAWHEATGRSIEVVHDRQSALTPRTRAVLQSLANHPHPDLPFKTPISGFVLVDSRDDPRVQAADIIAGFGALAGRKALKEGLDKKFASAIRPLVVCSSLWADEPSWRQLTK